MKSFAFIAVTFLAAVPSSLGAPVINRNVDSANAVDQLFKKDVYNEKRRNEQICTAYIAISRSCKSSDRVAIDERTPSSSTAYNGKRDANEVREHAKRGKHSAVYCGYSADRDDDDVDEKAVDGGFDDLGEKRKMSEYYD